MIENNPTMRICRPDAASPRRQLESSVQPSAKTTPTSSRTASTSAANRMNTMSLVAGTGVRPARMKESRQHTDNTEYDGSSTKTRQKTAVTLRAATAPYHSSVFRSFRPAGHRIAQPSVDRRGRRRVAILPRCCLNATIFPAKKLFASFIAADASAGCRDRGPSCARYCD